MSEELFAKRPRAFERGIYLWRFQDIPRTVKKDGTEAQNPVRDSAVFVVHGMGEQARLDTVVTLRDGFEEAIAELHRDYDQTAVPVPFTFEGYWADYDSLEQTFPDEWATFGERERTMFTGLWHRRAFSTIRTFAWFMRESLRIVADPKVVKTLTPLRWFTYCGVVVTGAFAFSYTLLRHPKILSRVLADVRLYLDPRGDIEKAIVQRIDRRVGEKFLLLLGLDWDFCDLPAEKRLHISGEPHTFSYVMWVAHSLGSVISYNVISDLLARCAETRQRLDCPDEALTMAERGLLSNVRRVETGLHRFITMGSPLEKIALLFPAALRQWPAGYEESFASKGTLHWWINFFHVWDPVSGRLRDRTLFPLAVNWHGGLWRVPGWAHVSYWKDKAILAYIITRTYGADVLKAPSIGFMGEEKAERIRRLSLPVWILVFGLVVWGAAAN